MRHDPAESDISVGPATLSEQPEAVQILFRHASAEERTGMVERAERLLAAGDLDGQGLFVARRGQRLTGAILASLAPGAVGLVWPPQEENGEPIVEDALVAAVVSWLTANGVRTAQALLRQEEAPLGNALVRNGFPHITTLWFMRHPLELPAVDWCEVGELDFQAFAPAQEALFERTLLETYEGTRDCPELNGVRAVKDILAGHRAQGRFDPETWWLVRHEGEAAGVLLVSAGLSNPAWELIYMGLRPGCRGRGLGRQLVRKALCAAKLAGAAELLLSVDERNCFARRLYDAVGFEIIEGRDVYLAILPRTSLG